MTFDEVGALASLSGGPSATTNIPAVHTLPVQSTFEEPKGQLEQHETVLQRLLPHLKLALVSNHSKVSTRGRI